MCESKNDKDNKDDSLSCVCGGTLAAWLSFFFTGPFIVLPH